MPNEHAGPGVDAERARDLGGAPLNTDAGFGHRAEEDDAPEAEQQEAKSAPKKETKKEEK
jgi:hypothetical protein